MSAHWKARREGGGRLALAAFRGFAARCGRAPARLLLLPVTGYFLLRRGAERRDSRGYLSRVFGRPATLGEVARHIHTFAATILDRLFLLSENTRRFDVHTSGLDTLHRHLDAGRGVLLFGSHLGSFEVLRVLSRQRPEFKIRVVLDRAHGKAMTELLDTLNADIASTVIDASQDGPSVALAIGAALDEGAMVALLVDRAQEGGPTQAVPFLGAPAEFPVAPWLLAAVLKVPVMLAFGLYRGGRRYDLVFEPFSEGVNLARREREAGVSALIRRYAERLEHHVRNAPYNWFNFYDFWKRDDALPPDAARLPAAGDAADVAGLGRTAGQ
ncbi:acyltransferase [Luteimonas deserti]|uniref:Acyltransferase n=1 Tax=Luteimonas deserti TaxID=2752306 RepID=A0A7Z0TSW4_9GAMM|nr:acyltransferase [Luteimonas deserti]NYZ61191.1 acyltransferase [Luteimonas deserti]